MPPDKSEKYKNILDDYVNSLIDAKLMNHDYSIKKEDAKEIVDHLMPELEKVVAKVVTKHIRALGETLLKKFEEE